MTIVANWNISRRIEVVTDAGHVGDVALLQEARTNALEVLDSAAGSVA